MIKESTGVHKKRVEDMLVNILRDLSEVGAIVGKDDMKVLSIISCRRQ
jgi:hypothetical protein